MTNETTLTAACVSDVGRKRSVNEDSYCLDEDLGLYLVADGMGGHGAGDIASATAASTMRETLDRHLTNAKGLNPSRDSSGDADEHDLTIEEQPNPLMTTIAGAVALANQTVFQLNTSRENPAGYGMGTTLVGFWRVTGQNHAVLFQVGDSRLYLARSQRMLQLTRDHTAYQEWQRNGRIGFEPPQNLILRAIGLFPQVSADVRMQTLLPGDRLLVCSDGLTSMVNDEAIAEVLFDQSHSNDEHTCRRLVELANNAGGDDNVTVLVVTVS